MSIQFINYADFGTSEPWVARISIGLVELVNLVDIKDYSQEHHQLIKDLIHDIVEELSNAFLAMRKLNEYKAQDIPLLTVKKEFDNFYDDLWAAYKDRMPKVAKELGYDIGFLFQNDKKFEEGSKIFLVEHKEIAQWFINMIKGDRDSWQNKLATLRNDYRQHKKVKIPPEELYNINDVKMAFDNCWQAIEDILATLIATRFPDIVKLRYLTPEEIDPQKPLRFGLATTLPLEEAK